VVSIPLIRFYVHKIPANAFIPINLEKILKKNFEISIPIDLRILNNSSLRFTQSILKNAKILFSKDEMKRIVFETSILNLYLDMKPHYDYYDKMRRIRYAN